MRRSWKHIVIYSMPLMIMAFIFIQSSLPADLSSDESGFFVDRICRFVHADKEAVTFFVRKAAHFFEYFVLGISLYLSVFTGMTEKTQMRGKKKRRQQREKRRRAGRDIRYPVISVQAAVIGVLFSMSDEIHQRFVPGRSCEVRDIVIDSIGILCGILVTVLFLKRKKSKASE